MLANLFVAKILLLRNEDVASLFLSGCVRFMKYHILSPFTLENTNSICVAPFDKYFV